MSKTKLLIVESPAKAKTIKKYLGDGFEVKASMGHVIDLPKKDMGIDIANNFQPKYEIIADKKRTISELKQAAKKADEVWIGTDEDREGEAIGRHLCHALKLDVSKTPRMVFHEITKSAIQDAMKNYRHIDTKLVDAQQARRVLDRLVGFELSPVLWKKVKPGLSAGRVQSVAVRLIVEREREISAFDTNTWFKIKGELITKDKDIVPVELDKKLKNKNQATAFLEEAKSSTFTITKIEKKPGKKTPAAPFTTSTLQQEASRKLSFSVSRTMQVAQKLYEAGFITYMRTDSVNISNDAMGAAGRVIEKEYGKEYSKPRKYKGKAKGAQEAHECIRPTNLAQKFAGNDAGQKRLYDLIWKRTIACQMADAEIEKTKVTIDVSESKNDLIANGEMITFDGFLKVYIEGTDTEEQEDQKGLLPQLQEKEILTNKELTATEKFTKHPPRYTEASLVKKLEELGIGRPSTYAPTISTVQKRGYVVKEDRSGIEKQYIEISLKNGNVTEKEKTMTTGAEKNKLFPTDIGMVVTDFLKQHFDSIMDYNFTASVEEDFDKIATGARKREAMIKEFYQPFHQTVEKTTEKADRASGERLLGKDPKTGKPVIARIGRYGPLVQIGSPDDEEKPKFASLKGKTNIENISLEEALEMFKLPRELGKYEEEEMVVNIGRFGPYVRHGNTFVSIKDPDDPLHITKTRAIELIKEKKESDAQKEILTFTHGKTAVRVLRGRYGPYIKYGRMNMKLPATYKKEREKLTEKIVTDIILETIDKNDTQVSKKTKAGTKKTKKTPAKKATTTKKKTTANKPKKRTTKKTTKKQ